MHGTSAHTTIPGRHALQKYQPQNIELNLFYHLNLANIKFCLIYTFWGLWIIIHIIYTLETCSWFSSRIAFLEFLFRQVRVITRTSRTIWNKETLVDTTKSQQAENKDLQGEVEDVESGLFVKPHGLGHWPWWSPVNPSFKPWDENAHAGWQRYDDYLGAHFALPEILFLLRSRQNDCRQEVEKRETCDNKQIGNSRQQDVATGVLRSRVQSVYWNDRRRNHHDQGTTNQDI